MKRLFLAVWVLAVLAFAGCPDNSDVWPVEDWQIETPVETPVEPAPPVEDPTDEYGYYLDACCRVYAGNSGGSGTCFKIDEQFVYILTCRHVAGSNKTAKVEFWVDGVVSKKYPAKVVRVLKVDAAVLTVERKLFEVLPNAIPVAREGVKSGDVIISVGCPGLSWQSLFEGHVLGEVGMSKNYNGGVTSFTFVPPPKGGRSGSGIFMDGKIVGILWGSDRKSTGYAVRCEDFVKEVELIGSREDMLGYFFTADWCNHCKEAKGIIQGLIDSGLGIQVLDYDHNTVLAELYDIGALPAYVNRKGDTLSGVRSADELRRFYEEGP